MQPGFCVGKALLLEVETDKTFNAVIVSGCSKFQILLLSDSSIASALKTAVTLKPIVGGQQALAAAWLSLAQVTEENAPQESLATSWR